MKTAENGITWKSDDSTVSVDWLAPFLTLSSLDLQISKKPFGAKLDHAFSSV